MTISTNLHNAATCRAKHYPGQVAANHEFTSIRFADSTGSDVFVFCDGDRSAAAIAIEDIFNGNLEGLAERIEEALDNANDMDVTFADFALHIACDLTGKDINEAFLACREAAE